MSHGGPVASGKRKRESRWSPIVEPPRAWVEKAASLAAPEGMEVEDRIRILTVEWSGIDGQRTASLVYPKGMENKISCSCGDSITMKRASRLEPPPETRALIEKTASFVAREGIEMEDKMMNLSIDRKRFSFFRCSDPNHAFYKQKLKECCDQFRDGTLPEPDDSLNFEQPFIRSLTPPPLSEYRLALHETICGSALAFPPGISLKELAIMKLTAQFVARYGSYFWTGLMKKVYRSPLFKFMQADYCWSGIYTDLILAYARVLRTSNSPFNDDLVEPFFNRLQLEKLDEGVETTTAIVDLHAYVGAVDCFTHMEYAHYSLDLEPPPRLSLIMNQLPQMPPDQNQEPDDVFEILEDPALMFPARITLKELGIMKLTAQFVARYGKSFLRALMMRVVMIPQFDFMEKTHSSFFFFNVLVDAYSHVLRPTKILKENDACTATVFDVFFHRLQLEKLEDGVETAMIDLHAFVGGLDFFAHRDNRRFSVTLPQPEPISTMRKWLTQPDMLLQHTLGSLLSEYRFQTHVIEDDHVDPNNFVADFLRTPPRRSLSFAFPANITLKELSVMKLTAQFEARYGSDFLCDLMMKPPFEFMISWSSFYDELVDAYVGVLKPHKKPKKSYVLEIFLQRLQLGKLEEGAEIAMVDLHAFMGGIDYFAHMDDINYSAIMPPPQRLSTMMNGVTQVRHDTLVQPQHSEYRFRDEQPDLELPPPERLRGLFPTAPRGWITLEEVGIIKMTAMFVARYGMHFSRELVKRVVMKPQFKFMTPTDSRFSFYKVFVDAYSRVLKPSNDVCMATVLESFFRCLQLEKVEEGVETATIDLHAFVSGVDHFAEMKDGYYSTQMENVDYSAIMPKPEGVSMTMNGETRNHSGRLFGLPSGSQIVRLQLEPNPHPQPCDQFESLAMGMLIRVVRSHGMVPPPPPPDEEPESKGHKFD